MKRAALAMLAAGVFVTGVAGVAAIAQAQDDGQGHGITTLSVKADSTANAVTIDWRTASPRQACYAWNPTSADEAEQTPSVIAETCPAEREPGQEFEMRTIPQGYTVLIDGEDHGRVDHSGSTTIEGVDPGVKHVIVLTSDQGYGDYTYNLFRDAWS